MKYVKLFENFAVKYEIIKDLPIPVDYEINYFINEDDMHKLDSITAYFDNKHYQEAKKKATNKKILSVYWFKSNNISQYQYALFTESLLSSDTRYSEIWIEVNFDEHFKLKHEFRGHNLKKFGV